MFNEQSFSILKGITLFIMGIYIILLIVFIFLFIFITSSAGLMAFMLTFPWSIVFFSVCEYLAPQLEMGKFLTVLGMLGGGLLNSCLLYFGIRLLKWSAQKEQFLNEYLREHLVLLENTEIRPRFLPFITYSQMFTIFIVCLILVLILFGRRLLLNGIP